MEKLKIVLFATHTQAIPALQRLATSGNQLTVISTDRIYPESLQLEAAVTHFGLDFVRLSNAALSTSLLTILQDIAPDICLVLTFSFRIPKAVFNIPLGGFYNIHFSMLPQNRGAAPVFWHIKTGLTNGGWSLIRLEEDLDAGPVVFQENLELMPGEIYGSYTARLSYAILPAIDKLLSQYQNKEKIIDVPQNEMMSYYPKPSQDDLKIDWHTQSAAEILRLVNACNPDYGGAITSINGSVVKILEVTEVNFQLNEPKAFGEIILAEPSYGIFVYCYGHTFLRINSLKLPEGYISGFKLIDLGLRTGARFENPVN